LKNRFTLQVLAACLLLLPIAVLSTRIINHLFPDAADIAGRSLQSLKPETKEFFNGLKEPMLLTYYSSEKRKTPTSMKGVEPEVRAFLRALKAIDPEKIDYRVMYPEVDRSKGPGYAASKRVSPVTVRKVEQDEQDEGKVWSSLVIAMQGKKEILIQNITVEFLPLLEDIVIEYIRSMENLIKPIFTLSMPGHFQLYTGLMKLYGKVNVVNLSKNPKIPDETDVLVWFEPEKVSEENISELKKFLRHGGTVIMAGSQYHALYGYDREGQLAYKARRIGAGISKLLQSFGLSLANDILMDKNPAPILWRDREGRTIPIFAPFHIRVFSALYDLKRFFFNSTGALNFVAPSAIRMDPLKLSEAGYRPEVIMASSENSRLVPIPRGLFNNDIFDKGAAVARQPMMVRLYPANPLHGEMLVLGSADMFRDGVINQKGFGHGKMVKNIAWTFTDQPRLVIRRLNRPVPQKMARLPSRERIKWRLIVAGAVPLVILIGMIAAFFRTWSFVSVSRHGFLLAVQCGLFVFLILKGSALWNMAWSKKWDVTQEKLNQAHPLIKKYVSEFEGDLRVELILTEKRNLPVSMKSMGTKITEKIKGLGIPVKIIRPKDLTDKDIKKFKKEGLEPFPVDTVSDDKVVKTNIWSAMRLISGNQSAVIPQMTDRNVDHMDFFMAVLLKKINKEPIPKIAIQVLLLGLGPENGFKTPSPVLALLNVKKLEGANSLPALG